MYLIIIFTQKQVFHQVYMSSILHHYKHNYTNSCESYHSKLNCHFYSGHPNIYQFIDELLELQSETYIKYRSNGIRKSKNNREKKFNEISDEQV
jgi:hypothetical protein